MATDIYSTGEKVSRKESFARLKSRVKKYSKKSRTTSFEKTHVKNQKITN